MTEHNWRSERPFGIDDGQLESVSKQEAFVLGYELALFDQRLETGGRIEMLIHSENRDRMFFLCDEKGRVATTSWMQDDSSENWLMLTVEGDNHAED